jgi:hypothetical protein
MNAAWVEELILQNWRVTIQDLSTALELSIRTVHNIVHEEHGYHKECACWVPWCMMELHKNWHSKIALSHLQWFKDEENDFLESIVTGDETWVHHFTSQTKQAGMQWKPPISPRTKKFKVRQSPGKVMAFAFWDAKGVIHTEFIPWGITCEWLLWWLHEAIRRDLDSCHNVWYFSTTVKPPHSACQTQELLQSFCSKLLDSPP